MALQSFLVLIWCPVVVYVFFFSWLFVVLAAASDVYLVFTLSVCTSMVSLDWVIYPGMTSAVFGPLEAVGILRAGGKCYIFDIRRCSLWLLPCCQCCMYTSSVGTSMTFFKLCNPPES